MKLFVISAKTVKDLLYHIEDNMPNYKDPMFDWSSIDGVKESDFELPDDLNEKMCDCYVEEGGKLKAKPNTTLSSCDGEAAILLFMALKELKPKIVAQHNLWVSLAHIPLMGYMRKRWPLIDNADFNDKSYIKAHWLNPDKIRNWLRGLYWQVKCSAIPPSDENGQWDFQYTKFFFSRQKLGNRGIAAAPYIIGNPVAVRGLLGFYKEFEKDFLSPHFEEKTDWCIQYINELGAKIELSTYNETDFRNELLKHRSEIEVIQDKKVAKKLREEESLQNSSDADAISKTHKNKKSNKSKKHKRKRR